MLSFLRKICSVIFRWNNESSSTQRLDLGDAPRFRRLELAGKGGFGNVYKTEDTILDRIVAEKIISYAFQKNLEHRARREAIILAKLSHPNIPAIYDIIPSDNSISIIFEWIDGTTLAEMIKDNALSIESTLSFFKDLCSALEFAHSHNIYHRDIKPSNIIIRRGNHSCVLVDFGIAKEKETANAITRVGEILGTRGYMAPEQERGGIINQTTDIYSLAVVLYECLSGTKLSVSDYRELAKINPEIPESVDNIIRLCLNESQEKRIQTAKNFFQRLKEAFDSPSADEIYQSWSICSLKVMCESLEHMDISDFRSVPAGYKAILLDRIKDLLVCNEYKMRNPLAKLLCILLSLLCDGDNFAFYMKSSLNFAFVVEYGINWFGNMELRQKILAIIPLASFRNIESIAEEIPIIITKISELPIPDSAKRMFYIEIKKIIIALLQRNHEPIISSMSLQLDYISKLIRD